eukprot:450727-Rhodomonas_salina.1
MLFSQASCAAKLNARSCMHGTLCTRKGFNLAVDEVGPVLLGCVSPERAKVLRGQSEGGESQRHAASGNMIPDPRP